jgi:hypothetical protein
MKRVCLRLAFRSIPSEYTFLRRIKESSTWKSWEQCDTILTLLLDGLDEGLIKIPDFIPFLTEELRGADLSRLRLVATCRTGSWQNGRVAEVVRVLPIDAFIFDDARRGRLAHPPKATTIPLLLLGPTGAWLQRTGPRSSRTAIPS